MDPRDYRHVWPRITDDTRAAVNAQLDEPGGISYYQRQGVFETFEDAFAASLGRRYALVVSSGTAGLHTAMVAAGFAPGHEVIAPAYTFYATVSPIFQTGAVPVLVDADEFDGNIDAAAIEASITPRTRAVMVTHMWGMPCDMWAIMEVCRRHGLLLIEDCSHAHGAVYQGRPAGSFGDIAVFSLQGQKLVTGGEGGIVVTDTPELHQRAVLFGQYNKRCKQEIPKDSPYYKYAVTGMGLKLRAHPFAIAMANEQFGNLPQWHKAMNANAAYLLEQLSNVPGLVLPVPRPGDEPSWYAFTMRVQPGILRISTAEFCDRLIEAGINDADMPGSTCPLNLLPLFQEPGFLFPQYEGVVAYREGQFPMAEAFFAQAIKLPIDVAETAEYRRVLDFYVETIRRLLRVYATS